MKTSLALQVVTVAVRTLWAGAVMQNRYPMSLWLG
jgi:hypothetical protein